MKQQFKEINFTAASLSVIQAANGIIASYQAQGLRLTLRQLYYQFVSANLLPNTEKSYRRLAGIISDGRLAGEIDWDAIEDRVRQPKAMPDWNNLAELTESALAQYRLPRWHDQDNYVELWVEKDALAGVLWPIARDYHVTLMVNRGYSSQSAMYESANRFLEARDANEEITKELHLLYLGDHDPSGEDMVRDIADRMELFGVDLTVKKIALTTAQVKAYKPPPNPAKFSDPRAPDYVAKHGRQSWEVDALPPNVLNKIVRAELDALIDKRAYERVKALETAHKKKLREAVKEIES